MSDSEKIPNFSDPRFLSLLRAGDRDAMAKIVRIYTEQIYRASLGLGFDKNSAHDLVQNVWTTFFDVVHEFQGKSHIRTFIFGILYNKASELRREQKRFDSSDPVEEVLEKRFDSKGHWVKPPVDPEEFLFGTETLELIDKCLEGLPLTQRMAFTLKEVAEEKSSDICKILNISVTNLGVLLFRARNRLRECIEGKIEKKRI